MLDFSYTNWGPYLFKSEAPKYIIDRLLIDGKKLIGQKEMRHFCYTPLSFLYNDDTKSWFINEIDIALESYRKGHIEYHGENYHGIIQEGRTINFELDELWINYMKPGDFNPRHNHLSDLSFVLFLDVPKELDEEQSKFKDRSDPPASLIFYYGSEARPQWATASKTFRPKAGEMFMFPSLLEHAVMPFESDVTRISVAGNISIT